MKKEIIELDSTFSPYTLDTYSTFDMEGAEYNILHYKNCDDDDKYDYDDFEWSYDMSGYLKDLSSERLHLLQNNIIDDVILSIENDGDVVRPREYNFTTDSQNNVFTVDIDALNEYIENNRAAYDRDKLQDASGFWWFGDENTTMLAYYLNAVSYELYGDNYLCDMIDGVSASNYIDYKKA